MKKSRAVALIVVLVIGILLLLPYFIEGLVWDTLMMSVLYGIGMVALVALLLISPTRQNAQGKAKGGETDEIKMTTSLACHDCDFSQEREFQKGDFIGKVLGKCPKCKKGELYIRAIYTVEEKKSGKRRLP
ncbi:MAG: hypothetical protein WED04_00315 [Promethearchaeati archaeon SRVP18_Atabeyarchaeia-1]